MTSLALTLEGIVDVIKTDILNPLITFLIAVATVVFMWGVIQFVIHAGEDTDRQQGIRHIIYGIVGIVIMVSAWGIINLIDCSLFQHHC